MPRESSEKLENGSEFIVRGQTAAVNDICGPRSTLIRRLIMLNSDKPMSSRAWTNLSDTRHRCRERPATTILPARYRERFRNGVLYDQHSTRLLPQAVPYPQ